LIRLCRVYHSLKSLLNISMDVPIVANVLGTLGAVFWSIQLIPQIVVNYRRHNATGLQPSMVRRLFTIFPTRRMDNPN
jgi:hypothetical protein